LIVSPNSGRSDCENRDSLFQEITKLETKNPEIAGFELTPILDASGFKFKNSNGDILLIAQISVEDIAELAYMIQQFEKRKKKGEPTHISTSISDRLMWMLTSKNFASNALLYDSSRSKEHNITIFEEDAKPGVKSIHAKGINVTISSVPDIKRHQVKMKLKDAAYLTTVPRSISEVSSLQRLPIARKMIMIADENVTTMEPFPTPVVVVGERKDLFLRANSPNQIHGAYAGKDKINLTPYSLQLVDGQHRVLSYYFSKGVNPDFEIDVVWYELPSNISPESKSSVMSKIFFDINFRSTRPDDALYYTHCATMTHDWTDGWASTPKKYSARAHVTKFLLLMNNHNYLKDYFQFQGIGATGEGIKSVVTYLEDAFAFKWMNKTGKSKKNANAICWLRYGSVDKSGNYVGPTSPSSVFPDLQVKYYGLPGDVTFGPTPHQLGTEFWNLLIKEFTEYLDALNLGLDKFDLFKHYCSENSSVLAAIWGVFYKILESQSSGLKTGVKLNLNKKALSSIGVILKALDLETHSMVTQEGGSLQSNCGFNSVTGGGGVQLFKRTFIDAYNKEPSLKKKLIH